MGTYLTDLDWPRVIIKKTGCFYHWSVEPMMKNAPCLNLGVEFSEGLAVTKAGNYVSMLLGEEPLSLQELLQCNM